MNIAVSFQAGLKGRARTLEPSAERTRRTRPGMTENVA